MTKDKKTEIDIYLNYDFWGRDGERIPKGTVVPMPAAVAKGLIQSGKGQRAEDMA